MCFYNHRHANTHNKDNVCNHYLNGLITVKKKKKTQKTDILIIPVLLTMTCS